jgi:hypothetical protein
MGQRETGGARDVDGRRQSSVGGRSRINREVYVRFCEGLGVQFPGSLLGNSPGLLGMGRKALIEHIWSGLPQKVEPVSGSQPFWCLDCSPPRRAMRSMTEQMFPVYRREPTMRSG